MNRLKYLGKDFFDIPGLRRMSKESFSSICNNFDSVWLDRYGTPEAFEIYADPEFVYAMHYCFTDYSRHSVRTALSYLKEIEFYPRRILDFYAGSGQTTAMLKAAFPESEVFFHTFGGEQERVGRAIFDANGLDVCVVHEPVSADLVFALEVLEHFEEPLSALDSIISPETLVYVDASTFTSMSAGHFREYNVNGRILNGRSTSAELRRHLCENHDMHRFWDSAYPLTDRVPFNGRPRLFHRRLRG